MPIPISKLYAVTDAKIAAVTADPAGGTTTYGASIDVPGIKSVSISGDINAVELRGDNRLLDSNATLAGVTVSFEYAKLNLDLLPVWLGGATTSSGVTPNEITQYRLLGSSSFAYWRFEAKTPTAGVDSVTGDAHIVLYKCILNGFPEFGFAEEDYQTFSVGANALARLSDDRWADLVINQTAVAIA